MDNKRWESVLEIELLMLFKWAIRRYIGSGKKSNYSGTIDVNNQVLVLLPRYGFALHALRRAIPFATLGMRTVVSVPSDYLTEAKVILDRLANEFRIEALFCVSDERPERLVHLYVEMGAIIVLTGRRSTFEVVISRYPQATMYGATGRCSVILGADRCRVASLETVLRSKLLPMSCTNHGASFICTNYLDGELVMPSEGSNRNQVRETLSDSIRQIHPSIVLVSQNDETTVEIPMEISGYAVFKCDAQGEPLSREGLGRDPICGWPGDYCV